MSYFFHFESDFVDSLRCIPMQIRYYLDTCGVKLKLSHWHQFSPEEREFLLTLPCESPGEIQIYRDALQQLVSKYNGQPASELEIADHPDWLNLTVIPSTVLEKAETENVEITLEQWQKLTPLQRFVLIKLSRPSHENRNFLPAIQEFNLAERH